MRQKVTGAEIMLLCDVSTITFLLLLLVCGKGAVERTHNDKVATVEIAIQFSEKLLLSWMAANCCRLTVCYKFKLKARQRLKIYSLQSKFCLQLLYVNNVVSSNQNLLHELLIIILITEIESNITAIDRRWKREMADFSSFKNNVLIAYTCILP